MRILVVIVTYNGQKWMGRCLGSVRASSLAADAYVVDNGSSDGTADYVATYFPWAKLVRNATNVGFAEANNMGIRYALEQGYHYVYLLNQDAWLLEDTLSELVSVAERYPSYGVLSPMQLQADGRTLDGQFAKRVAHADLSRTVCEVPFVMAAHWLVSRRAIEAVGCFAPFFPIWGNDDNLCHRMYYHGFKVGVVPTAKAVHDRASRVEGKDRQIRRNYYGAALVRLCDVRRPLLGAMCYVMGLTAMKTINICQFSPLRYFLRIIFRDWGQICVVRRMSRGVGAFL